MESIYTYLDYRKFLRDSYEDRKKGRAAFSIRYMSKRVAINPGFIARLMAGKVHLGLGKVAAFAHLFGLEGRERKYFSELVRFGRAKDPEEIQNLLKRLQALKGLDFRTLADDQMEFFETWYHMPMRSLLSIHPFSGANFRKLGSLLTPAISAEEAKASVGLLERLGLIKRDDKGIYVVTDALVTTREKWSSIAVHNYQKRNIQLSLNALENIAKSQRDISTVTFTCSARRLDYLRERLRSLREEMLRLSQDDPLEDTVLQLNLQLFPVASLRGDLA